MDLQEYISLGGTLPDDSTAVSDHKRNRKAFSSDENSNHEVYSSKYPREKGKSHKDMYLVHKDHAANAKRDLDALQRLSHDDPSENTFSNRNHITKLRKKLIHHEKAAAYHHARGHSYFAKFKPSNLVRKAINKRALTPEQRYDLHKHAAKTYSDLIEKIHKESGGRLSHEQHNQIRNLYHKVKQSEAEASKYAPHSEVSAGELVEAFSPAHPIKSIRYRRQRGKSHADMYLIHKDHADSAKRDLDDLQTATHEDPAKITVRNHRKMVRLRKKLIHHERAADFHHKMGHSVVEKFNPSHVVKKAINKYGLSDHERYNLHKHESKKYADRIKSIHKESGGNLTPEHRNEIDVLHYKIRESEKNAEKYSKNQPHEHHEVYSSKYPRDAGKSHADMYLIHKDHADDAKRDLDALQRISHDNPAENTIINRHKMSKLRKKLIHHERAADYHHKKGHSKIAEFHPTNVKKTINRVIDKYKMTPSERHEHHKKESRDYADQIKSIHKESGGDLTPEQRDHIKNLFYKLKESEKNAEKYSKHAHHEQHHEHHEVEAFNSLPSLIPHPIKNMKYKVHPGKTHADMYGIHKDLAKQARSQLDDLQDKMHKNPNDNNYSNRRQMKKLKNAAVHHENAAYWHHKKGHSLLNMFSPTNIKKSLNERGIGGDGDGGGNKLPKGVSHEDLYHIHKNNARKYADQLRHMQLNNDLSDEHIKKMRDVHKKVKEANDLAEKHRVPDMHRDSGMGDSMHNGHKYGGFFNSLSPEMRHHYSSIHPETFGGGYHFGYHNHNMSGIDDNSQYHRNMSRYHAKVAHNLSSMHRPGDPTSHETAMTIQHHINMSRHHNKLANGF